MNNPPMICAGHQPNYLPYAGFLHKAMRVDRFILVDNVQYVKRGPFGWIHRNRIRTPEGWQWLSVPVLSKGKFTQKIQEVLIDPTKEWRKAHWRSIEWNYRKAPHFAAHAERFKAIYERDWERLVDLSEAVIRALFDGFEIRVPLDRSSALGAEAPATDLIVALCRSVGADTYLSGIHGRDYLDEEKVKAAGIGLVYQEMPDLVYPQCQPGPFVPDLSAIDLLFNVGPKAREILLQGKPDPKPRMNTDERR